MSMTGLTPEQRRLIEQVGDRLLPIIDGENTVAPSRMREQMNVQDASTIRKPRLSGGGFRKRVFHGQQGT